MGLSVTPPGWWGCPQWISPRFTRHTSEPNITRGVGGGGGKDRRAPHRSFHTDLTCFLISPVHISPRHLLPKLHETCGLSLHLLCCCTNGQKFYPQASQRSNVPPFGENYPGPEEDRFKSQDTELDTRSRRVRVYWVAEPLRGYKGARGSRKTDSTSPTYRGAPRDFSLISLEHVKRKWCLLRTENTQSYIYK